MHFTSYLPPPKTSFFPTGPAWIVGVEGGGSEGREAII